MVVCMSLDGFIGRADGSPPNQEKYGGWTSTEDKAEFRKELEKSDIVLLGRRTFAQTPEFVWGKKPVAIVTSDPNVESGRWLIPPQYDGMRHFLDSMHGARVLLCGGSRTYDFMLRWNLVSTMTVVIEPLLMKRGVRLTTPPPTSGGQAENRFVLTRVHVLNPRGTVRLDYRRVNQWK